jgi:L-alanine-DL-glutamate epimerase-like enolase superfamily enzyme
MKIAHIEMIPIAMPLAKRYDNHHGRMRMYDIDQHLVVKVHTDNGLVGYGDYEDNPHPVPKHIIDSLIGRDPFDFIHNNLHLALGMALYDLMGKHLGVPAHKLMGQKVRDAAPVAAWTRPCPPEVFREEIRRAAEAGYTIFKMHSDARFDVIEQTRAAEEVAPPGFKLHWDFNHNRTLGTVLPIIAQLERDHPIVGFIEDPLVWSDIEGWRTLREKTRIPLIMHVPPLGGIQELIRGVADIYMIGGGIGETLVSGFAYARANTQVLIQQSGNTLMKALSLHQAAVLPTASAHLITLDDQYEEDITTHRIPVIGGSSPVPEGPGLGVEIDEEALARAAARKHIETPRFVGMLRLPGGYTAYSLGNPNVARLTGREEGAIPGISYEYWEEDGSAEFERTWARVEREGSFVERTGSG